MENTRLGRRCQLCGDVGFKELLVTCTKCAISTEHVYCMRNNRTVVPKEWFCENCNQDKINRKENFQNTSSSAVMQGSFTKKAKVKFLPVEEVIKLSSGATPQLRSPSRTNLDYRSGTSMTPKFSPLRTKPNLRDVFPMKPPQHGRIQVRTSKEKKVTFHPAISSGYKEHNTAFNMTPKQVKTCNINSLLKEGEKCDATFISKDERICNKKTDEAANKSLFTSSRSGHHLPSVEERVSVTPIEDHLFEKVNVPISIKEMDTGIVAKKSLGSKASSSRPSRLSPPIHCSGGSHYPVIDSKKPEVEGEERPIPTTVAKQCAYRPYFPAKEEIWNFKFVDTVMPGEFYGGLKAQPPSRVSRKAYEFARTMPRILQVALHPRDLVWDNLFQNYLPDLHDIALYFFPCDNVERSKENYANLFQLLEAKNSVMISHMGDVKLLIFTSKQLHVDSPDVERSIRKQFLWAIFSHSKDKIPQPISPIDMEIDMEGGQPLGRIDVVVSEKRVCGKPVDNISSNALPQHISPIDMEIDMEGGQPLGRVDVVVSGKRVCGKPVDNISSNALDTTIQQLRLTSGQSQSNMLSLLNSADAGQALDLPPGFEDLARQKAPLDDKSVIKVENIDLQVVTEDENPQPEDKFKAEKLGQDEYKSPGETSWTLPPKGWIKLNVATCLKEETPLAAGGGGIIRDESGKWIRGYSVHYKTILEAEMWSIYQGLVFAWEKGFRKVVVESESPLTVEHLKKTPTTENHNSISIDSCVNIMKRDWECKVVLIHRNANLPATWLATRFDDHEKGVKFFKSPPDGLVPLLHNDSSLKQGL
ncbi:uncharacterized protein [Euphorbia lathyris]|uniref:uncharacterized protein isoform X2 n=1 Tax=Euphorbia lathyris TaxID=212925 RepID=UPI0033142ABF